MGKKASTSEAPTSGAAEVSALQKERQAMIMELAEKAPAKVKPYVQKFAPQMAQAAVLVERQVIPGVMKAFNEGQRLCKLAQPYYEHYRIDFLLPALVGLALCFCGGYFPLTIAAVEAFRMTGYGPVLRAFGELKEQGLKALEAHRKDEAEDKDGDGVPDVKQISNKTLLARKGLILLKTVDPDKVQQAVAALMAGFVAVLASVKMTFARSLALGSSIGDQLKRPAERYVSPVINNATPEEYRKWVPLAVSYLCQLVAVSIAMMLIRVISAAHSAVRGGLMFGRGVVAYLHKFGMIKDAPEDTHLDELVGYGAAALGLLWQLTSGFSLPFPLNLLLLPATMVEWVFELLVAAS